MIALLLFQKKTPWKSIPLREKISIGRDFSNTYRISDKDISRIHLSLDPTTKGAIITDQSTNGIFHNGKRLTGTTALKIGDSFEFGQWRGEIIWEEAKNLLAPTVRTDSLNRKILGYNVGKKTLLIEKLIFDITSPDKKTSRYEMAQRHISFGKDSKASIVINKDNHVSTQHCLFYEENGNHYLKDLNSANGTFFQGQALLHVQQMPTEGQFQIGLTKIKYCVDKKKEKIEKIINTPIPTDIIVEDQKMKEIISLIEKVAPSDTTVLILGESGVGKDVIAQLLHLWSDRAAGPFIAVNCASLTKEVVESAFFGHEKGAFTGASGIHKGFFEQANNGTLFLDEIGELAPSMQSSLLRILENKIVHRMGGDKDIKVNVRVLAGTNRNLKSEVKYGNFREDLYYRLNIIPIMIPPLRDRSKDIPKLIEHYMTSFDSKLPAKHFTAEAIKKLTSYYWPGNIRQLKNYITRLFYDPRIEKTIKAKDIEFDFATQCDSQAHTDVSLSNASDYKVKSLKEVERMAIINAIRAMPNATQQVLAPKLGINRTTLNYKLNEHEIDMNAEQKLSLKNNLKP